MTLKIPFDQQKEKVLPVDGEYTLQQIKTITLKDGVIVRIEGEDSAAIQQPKGI